MNENTENIEDTEHPQQHKEEERAINAVKLFNIGCSCLKNWRIPQKEYQTYIVSTMEDPTVGFFGLYDGYGDEWVAQYATKHLQQLIFQNTELLGNNIEKALKQSFLDIDNTMQNQDCAAEKLCVGSSALVVMIKENFLYCADVGSSQAIASVKGQLVQLSVEHKPTNDNPHVSRSFGDFKLKRAQLKPTEFIYTAYPNLETFDITNEWEFVLICCNGVWNAMPPMELLHFCRQRIGRGMQPTDICKELMIHCFTPHPERKHYRWDGNLSVILICLLHNNPYADLVSRCAETNKDDKPIAST